MRLPANLGRLLPALCLGVLLSACSTFGQRDPLRIDLVGLEPCRGKAWRCASWSSCGYRTPTTSRSNTTASPSTSTSTASPGQRRQRPTGEVPRFGERVVSVPLTVSAFSAFRQAWGLSNNAPIQGMPYVVKGKLAGGLFAPCASAKRAPSTLRAGRRRAEDQGL